MYDFFYTVTIKEGDYMFKKTKKTQIFTVFALFFIFLLPVSVCNAAIKCVAMGTGSSCSADSTEQSQSDWGGVCNGVAVHGVSVCGGWFEGRDLNGVLHKESIHFDSSPAGNTSCFCKLVQPVVSRWVFAEEFKDEGGEASGYRCTKYCAATCAGKMANKGANAAFFNTLMGELYE